MSASIPVGVAGANEHCAVHDCKDMNFIGDMFIDNAVWTAQRLAETFETRRKRPETFFWNPVAEFGEGWKQARRFSKIAVPTAGNFAGLLAEDETDDAYALVMRVPGPFDAHRHSPFVVISSSMFSISLKDSSSVRHSPFSNCLREMAMAFASSAFWRNDSISSHVLSKSATLIITLVLRPFCVMTMGRCVRAVRAKQSLRVRRYSVKGTTSSSRRGRSIVLAFVRMICAPIGNTSMVHYSVPRVKGGIYELKGAA